jgi:hypothetical protein
MFMCCHISCPSNMGFARLDPGLWEMLIRAYVTAILMEFHISDPVLGFAML